MSQLHLLLFHPMSPALPLLFTSSPERNLFLMISLKWLNAILFLQSPAVCSLSHSTLRAVKKLVPSMPRDWRRFKQNKKYRLFCRHNVAKSSDPRKSMTSRGISVVWKGDLPNTLERWQLGQCHICKHTLSPFIVCSLHTYYPVISLFYSQHNEDAVADTLWVQMSNQQQMMPPLQQSSAPAWKAKRNALWAKWQHSF